MRCGDRALEDASPRSRRRLDRTPSGPEPRLAPRGQPRSVRPRGTAGRRLGPPGALGRAPNRPPDLHSGCAGVPATALWGRVLAFRHAGVRLSLQELGWW